MINYYHCHGPEGMTDACVNVMKREKEFKGSGHTHMWYSVYVLQIMEMWECHSVSLHHHRTVKQISSGMNFSVVLLSHSQPANTEWSEVLSDCFTIHCRGSATERTTEHKQFLLHPFVSRDVTNTVMKTFDELECLYTLWWRKLVPLSKFWQIYKHWQN